MRNFKGCGEDTGVTVPKMKIAVLPGDDIGPEITAATLADPARRTKDLGGGLGTREFGAVIAEGVATG